MLDEKRVLFRSYLSTGTVCMRKTKYLRRERSDQTLSTVEESFKTVVFSNVTNMNPVSGPRKPVLPSDFEHFRTAVCTVGRVGGGLPWDPPRKVVLTVFEDSSCSLVLFAVKFGTHSGVVWVYMFV